VLLPEGNVTSANVGGNTDEIRATARADHHVLDRVAADASPSGNGVLRGTMESTPLSWVDDFAVDLRDDLRVCELLRHVFPDVLDCDRTSLPVAGSARPSVRGLLVHVRKHCPNRPFRKVVEKERVVQNTENRERRMIVETKNSLVLIVLS
jgi:hypothetical protein